MNRKMDSRSTPATARMAHISLRGIVDAPAYTSGETLRVTAPLVDLLTAPNGKRDRQLCLGQAFTVIDRDGDMAFGFAGRDGFCGWLPANTLAKAAQPTHWIATPGTHLYAEPRVQGANLAALTMGCEVEIIADAGKFQQTPHGYIPTPHLMPLTQRHHDPVTVAEGFLHRPYLWGGNSSAGIDCSGLTQTALLACGIACPGDSDQQEALGHELPPDAPLRRGDLLFWKGHVALIVDATRLIHANGHSMSVAYEDTAACIARVIAQDGGPVTHRRRL